MHAIRRFLALSLIALSSLCAQTPVDPKLPPGVPAAPEPAPEPTPVPEPAPTPTPSPTVRPVIPAVPRPVLPNGAAPAPAVADVPLAERKITEPIAEPKMTGNDLAAKYRAFTGRRVIVSAAAAAAEFSFIQDASVADPLTYAKATKLIKMAALLEGFVFVPAGDIDPDVDKLMFSAASAGPKREGIGIFDENDALPDEDRVVTYVMTFKFLKPDEAVRVFTTIIGEFGSYGSIAPIANASAVIITEKTSLIRKLIELKVVIDKPSSDVTTRFIKVQFADVTELAETLNQLLSAQQQTQQTAGVQRTDAPVNPSIPVLNNPAGASGNRAASSSAEAAPPQIVPDSRTNRIFVMGRPVDVVFVEGLVREFDTQTSEKNFLRRKLSYLSASEFLPIAGDALTRAFSSTSSGGSGGGAGSTGANFGQGGAAGGSNRGAGSTSSGNRSTSSNRSTGSSSSGSSFGGKGGTGGTGGGGSSDVGSLSEPSTSTAPTSLIVGRTLLVADNITNSIIVQGPPAGLEIIEKLLDEVDVRADQVMISAVFGQLTLNDNLDYGVNIIRSLDKSSLNKGNSAIGGGNVNGGSTPNIPGLLDPATYRAGFASAGLNVYGMLSNQFNVYVNALQSTGNFSVLSRPSIYTANNKKGVISSGQRIAVPSNTNTFNNGGVGGASQSTNIEYQDVVLKLEIIPLINSEKEVTLQIVLTSDEVGDPQKVGELTVPNIITRSMTTTVTVPNNQTVVLGGLVVTRDRDSVSGIPILSSIPGIGKLFSTTTKDKEKSELLIFIQPSIVRNAENLDNVQADMGRRYKVTPELRRFADGPGVLPPPDSIVPVNEKASDYAASAGPIKTVRGNTVVEEAPAKKSVKRMGHPGH